MTEPLDLDAIRARADAATPGPWENYPQYGHDFYAYLGGEYLRGVGNLNFGTGDEAEADLAFVLAARQDVPALLAEVRLLRAKLDNALATGEQAIKAEAQAVRDLEAQNVALRAALVEARQQNAAVRQWVANTLHGTAAAEVGALVGQQPMPVEYCGHCKRTHLDCRC